MNWHTSFSFGHITVGAHVKYPRRYIGGKFPFNPLFLFRKAKIDGKVPPIDLKISKMKNFTVLNRKISAYIPLKLVNSPYNRKISAYFACAENSPKMGCTKTGYHSTMD